MKIGQMCFFQLTSETENPYGSHVYGSRYQGQRGPTASRSYLNFYRSDVTDVSGTDAPVADESVSGEPDAH
jgi:dCTP deaminase